MRRCLPAGLGLLLLVPILDACKCESSKVKKAFDSYMGFSKGKDFTGGSAEEKPAYTVRSRREAFAHGRSRAIADIEVDPGLDRSKLEKALRDACHDVRISRDVSAIKVLAWPGKLERLVAPIGEAVFARDGHGWDGKGVAFEEIRVRLPSRKELNSRGLTLLTEKEYLRALGVDNLLRRGETIEKAVEKTARFHGIPVGHVQSAVDKATRLFGKPEAPEPATVPRP